MAFIIGAVFYVFGSLGYYAIAKRRGIQHAWLAWVPIGNAWLLGCISDQYQSVAKGNVKNKRTVLLVLNIVMVVAMIVLIVLMAMFMVQVFANIDFSELPSGEDPFDYGYDAGFNYGFENAPEMAGGLLGAVFAYFVMFGVSIAAAIVQFIAMYDLYQSCDPDNATLFLVLSIFLGIAPFLVFACREKDYGMPMRHAPQPVYQPYQPIYQQPYQPAAEQPPVEQPAAPPAEPWERKEP